MASAVASQSLAAGISILQRRGMQPPPQQLEHKEYSIASRFTRLSSSAGMV